MSILVFLWEIISKLTNCGYHWYYKAAIFNKYPSWSEHLCNFHLPVSSRYTHACLNVQRYYCCKGLRNFHLPVFFCDKHTQCCVFTAVSISSKSFFAANITVRSQKRKDVSLFLSSLIIYFSLIILNDFLPLPLQLPFLFPSTFTCVSKDSVV